MPSGKSSPIVCVGKTITSSVKAATHPENNLQKQMASLGKGPGLKDVAHMALSLSHLRLWEFKGRVSATCRIYAKTYRMVAARIDDHGGATRVRHGSHGVPALPHHVRQTPETKN
eukprot:CAMPEP_0203852030 /NCGR_PEP_ID=MMETSP0359-20131031/7683_1 /ASSEMBLY_ACC=CAM_ASM_000338 /TAXON_ID=268821 /ORGANISM="Scrippsiella Hangoei, Strain SHTV-5" /LENGTH=114 /DNA_ID=CAMNT_0050768113 /DNA_START=77 /DNA_END=422 /DNA_ORIENTATION=+